MKAILLTTFVVLLAATLSAQEDCCKTGASARTKKVTDDATQELQATAIASVNAKDVSLYRVPLVCPAAPHIGCGGRAKPILKQLEEQEGVSQVWLNREGTILAIVWKDNSERSLHMKAIKDVCDARQLTLTELKNKEYEQALERLKSGKDWYRLENIDQLSMHEAEVIVARLVGRVKAKVSLSDGKSSKLQSELLRRCRELLLGKTTADRRSIEDELYRSVQGFLDKEELAALKEAIALGFRQLANEQ